jgi:hypothetical protein
MWVEIGTEAEQIIFWECINGIFVAVYMGGWVQTLPTYVEGERACLLTQIHVGGRGSIDDWDGMAGPLQAEQLHGLVGSPLTRHTVRQWHHHLQMVILVGQSHEIVQNLSVVSVSYYYLVNGFADYLELADIDVVDRFLGKRFLGSRILCAACNKKYKKAGLLLSLFFKYRQRIR